MVELWSIIYLETLVIKFCEGAANHPMHGHILIYSTNLKSEIHNTFYLTINVKEVLKLDIPVVYQAQLQME